MIGSGKQLISYSYKGDSEHIGPIQKKDEVKFEFDVHRRQQHRHSPRSVHSSDLAALQWANFPSRSRVCVTSPALAQFASASSASYAQSTSSVTA